MLRSFIILAISVTSPLLAHAVNNYCDGSVRQPCLVSDNDTSTEAIRNWRTMQMMAKQYRGNTFGLANIRASGSAAITADNFTTIKSTIISSTTPAPTRIIDLDLREESHIFLNNFSITLMSDNDWINLGKSHDETLNSELHWMQTLQGNEQLTGVLTSAQFKDHQLDQGIGITIESINTEKLIAENHGYDYYRLTVSDHMAPRDEEVERFILLLKDINPTDWLHIHCRGGEGRTTTFLAMYDMIINANQVSFEEIIKRQASVEPYYDLSVIKRKNSELIPYYEKRFDFLKEFYQFAIEYKTNNNLSWIQWKKRHQNKHPNPS